MHEDLKGPWIHQQYTIDKSTQNDIKKEREILYIYLKKAEKTKT